MEQLTRRLVYDTLKAECTEKWGATWGKPKFWGPCPSWPPPVKTPLMQTIVSIDNDGAT